MRARYVVPAVILILLALAGAHIFAAQTQWTLLIVGADDNDWNSRDKESQLVKALAPEIKLAGISDDRLWILAYHFNKPEEKSICVAAPLNLKKEDLPFIGIVRARTSGDAIGEFIEVRRGFRKVEPRHAHEIVDTALQALGMPTKGAIEVTSEPSDAEVFLEGGAEPRKIGTTPLSFDGLDWGNVEVAVRKKFHTQSTFKVSIAPGKTVKAPPVKLERLPVGLLIAYSGEQTDLIVDLQRIYGRIIKENPDLAEQLPLIPRQLTGASGNKMLDEMGVKESDLPLAAIVTHREHNPVEQVKMWKRVNDASTTMQDALKAADEILGRRIRIPESTVDVATEPSDAAIAIDGKPVGRRPLKNHPLGTGRHTLEVSKEGFIKQSQSFSLLLGDSQSFTVVLKPVPKASIDVVMEPGDAIVRIDGKQVSTGPVFNYEVDPGDHEVEITRENYTREVRKKRLDTGENWSLRGIKLNPVPVGILVAYSESGGSTGYFFEKYHRKFIEMNSKVLSEGMLPLSILKTNNEDDLRKLRDLGISEGTLPLVSVVDRTDNRRLIWKAENVADPCGEFQRAMEFVGRHLKLEIRPPISRVDIITNVPDATLVIDDRTTLKTPVIGYEIASGKHTLEIRKEKYLTMRVELIVEYGDYKRHIYTLSEEKGKLIVKALTEDGQELTGAVISIDGHQAAVIKGAEVSLDLDAGPHELLVSREGYESYSEKVTIEGGRTKTVAAKVKKKILTVLGRMSAQGAQLTQGDMIVANVDVRVDKMKSLFNEGFKSFANTNLLWESEDVDYKKIHLLMKVTLEISLESGGGECIVTIGFKPVETGGAAQKTEPLVRRKPMPANIPATLMETKANQVLEGLIREMLPEVEAAIKSCTK
jgi:hypothetical protein